MWRYLIGAVAATLFGVAGLFIWRAYAEQPRNPVPPAPAALVTSTETAAPDSFADLAPPPAATEKSKEEKRFSRYDKDKNGSVARDEYLVTRQKAFAKLDTNGDGHLSFDEYATKAETKFAAAARDRNGALNASEFATTRPVRKTKSRAKCAPSLRAPAPADAEDAQG
jgi:hypothetical protein